MPDEPVTPPVIQTPPITPTPPRNDEDIIKMAQELGEHKKQNETNKEFIQRVNPVLETIYSDQDLYQHVVKVHEKRLGITQTPPAGDPPKDPANNTPPAMSESEKDTRNTLASTAAREFEKDKGIDKLSPEKRGIVNKILSTELHDMLDPKGNKSFKEVMEDVSLSKLPNYLEKAFTLAEKNPEVKAALAELKPHEDEDGDDNGIFGSLPSGRVDPSSVKLSAQEKRVAGKMGVSEEKYLENKKNRLKERGY